MPSVKFHGVSTGPVAGDIPYRCEQCGAETTARVVTTGRGSSFSVHGFGRDDESAMRAAYREANRKALFALYRAPCPRCKKLHPALEARLPLLIARGTRRKRRSIPIAIGVALVAFGLAWIPYRGELVASGGVYIAAGLAAFCAGVAFLLSGAPVAAPDFTRPAPVWFWWTTPHGTGWIEAELPSPRPNVPRWPTLTFWLVGILSMFGLGAVVVGWLADVSTTAEVTVVLTAPERGPMIVRRDGKEVARVSSNDKSLVTTDVPLTKIGLRVDRTYKIEIERAQGDVRSFTFTPRKGDRGWVIAPDAEQSDLCFVATKVFEIGKAPSNENSVERLSLDGDVLTIDRLYLAFLHAPLEPKPGEEKSFMNFDSSLRAVSCAAFASGALVPYRATAP